MKLIFSSRTYVLEYQNYIRTLALVIVFTVLGEAFSSASWISSITYFRLIQYICESTVKIFKYFWECLQLVLFNNIYTKTDKSSMIFFFFLILDIPKYQEPLVFKICIKNWLNVTQNKLHNFLKWASYGFIKIDDTC